MASKKKRTVSWDCKSCRFKGGSMSELKAHYGRKPDHNPVNYSSQRPKGGQRKHTTKSVKISPRVTVRYCPSCGTNIEAIIAALQMKEIHGA